MPRMISKELKQAYEDTLFSAQLATSVDFKHGEASAKADALLVLFDVQTAILITAWNPYSEPKTKEENEAAQARLEAELTAKGIRFLPAIGKGTSDEWAEPSVLALGVEFLAAQTLAVKYQQNAYLWIEKGFPAELIYPDPDAIADQASIVVVDSREQSTMASSWREYLCVRWFGDRVELSVRMHEGLANASAFPENDVGERIIPLQIDGKTVVGVDDDVVVGGDLGCNDDEPQTFLLADGTGMTEWFNARNWSESEKLSYIVALLDRFKYNKEIQLGFLFFLGGSMLVTQPSQPVENLLECQAQIAKFDINDEYEALLGPLRDIIMLRHLEEFAWRSDIDIETRAIKIPNVDAEIRAYNFKNYGLLFSDDRKITTMFESAKSLRTMFEAIGHQLNENSFTAKMSYKAGMCFFNLNAQSDLKATVNLTSEISKLFDPVLNGIETIAKSTTSRCDVYTDIQFALYFFINVYEFDFSQVLWFYQSWIFYSNGEEIPGVASSDHLEFLTQCRVKAFAFFQAKSEAVLQCAKMDIHFDVFPPFREDVDDGAAIAQTVGAVWGDGEIDSYVDMITTRALIILGYFSSICEASLISERQRLMH